jgi:hypothetical protein
VPQDPQFWLSVVSDAQMPSALQQTVPLVQQATWAELVEGQRFFVFPPHCLHAVLQLGRWGLGRLLQ